MPWAAPCAADPSCAVARSLEPRDLQRMRDRDVAVQYTRGSSGKPVKRLSKLACSISASLCAFVRARVQVMSGGVQHPAIGRLPSRKPTNSSLRSLSKAAANLEGLSQPTRTSRWTGQVPGVISRIHLASSAVSCAAAASSVTPPKAPPQTAVVPALSACLAATGGALSDSFFFKRRQAARAVRFPQTSASTSPSSWSSSQLAVCRLRIHKGPRLPSSARPRGSTRSRPSHAESAPRLLPSTGSISAERRRLLELEGDPLPGWGWVAASQVGDFFLSQDSALPPGFAGFGDQNLLLPPPAAPESGALFLLRAASARP